MNKYKNLKLLSEQSNTQFLTYYKNNKKRLAKMDDIVHQLHADISCKIDCLSCANCCRTLGPAIYDKDIERIAKALRRKPSDIIVSYLKIDDDGDYVFKEMPCPFLMPDNYCSIYESRPKACREYPHTDRRRFEQIYHLTVTNTSTCPIAYEVLIALMDK